jgi:AcrR family transcriptional regulator
MILGRSSAMATERSDTYHHGNLRQALLDAAMELVRERGVEGLTLREVARRAGVSHNAPYHHFADKGALVSALAIEGFGRFEASFRDALERTPGTHLERIRAIGGAYVRFAFDDPARFTLMWRPELRSVGDDSEVDQAGLASYQVLIDEIVAGQRAGEIRAGDEGLLALAAWSLVHGLAILIVDGPLRDQVAAWSMVEPLLEPVLDMAERGLVP